WLRARGVTEVDVVGIATDHCVRATAEDAAAAGFATRVLLGLTAGVSRETTDAALRRLAELSVAVRGAPVCAACPRGRRRGCGPRAAHPPVLCFAALLRCAARVRAPVRRCRWPSGPGPGWPGPARGRGRRRRRGCRPARCRAPSAR